MLAADSDKETAVPTGACTWWKHADWQDWPQPQDWAAGHSFVAWTAFAENGNLIWTVLWSFATLLLYVYFSVTFTDNDWLFKQGLTSH